MNFGRTSTQLYLIYINVSRRGREVPPAKTPSSSPDPVVPQPSSIQSLPLKHRLHVAPLHAILQKKALSGLNSFPDSLNEDRWQELKLASESRGLSTEQKRLASYAALFAIPLSRLLLFSNTGWLALALSICWLESSSCIYWKCKTAMDFTLSGVPLQLYLLLCRIGNYLASLIKESCPAKPLFVSFPESFGISPEENVRIQFINVKILG